MRDGRPDGSARKKPEVLTLEELTAILFPDGFKVQPPPSWKLGKPPTPALPIDDAVTQLINKNLLRADFSSRSTKRKCPYFSARFWIHQAAIEAMGKDVLPTDRTNVRRHLAKQLIAATNLKIALEDFVRSFSDDPADVQVPSFFWIAAKLAPPVDYIFDTPGVGYNQHNESRANLNEAEEHLRKAVAAVEMIGSAIYEAMETAADIKTDAWLSAFIEVLGFCWMELTGAKPFFRDQSFTDFVQQAYTTLGGRASDWGERRFRTALARVDARPEWGGFERYEKGLYPPGATVRSFQELERSKADGFDRWKVRMREHVPKALSGNGESLLEVLDGLDLYGAEGEEYAAALGWRRPSSLTKKH